MAKVHNRSHVADLRGRFTLLPPPPFVGNRTSLFVEDTPTDLEPLLLMEKDSSAQGHARGRRVCSFIGVGFPWPLRSPVSATEGESQEGAGVGEGAAGPVPMREEIGGEG